MGVWLNFEQGCAAHSFKMEPKATPIFVKMVPLARLISASKVPCVSVSLTKLAKFSYSLDQHKRKFGFLYRNYRSKTE